MMSIVIERRSRGDSNLENVAIGDKYWMIVTY